MVGTDPLRAIKVTLAITAFLAAIVGPALIVQPVSAGAIAVLESTVEYSFAQHVTFTLTVTSDAEIAEVYLFFRAAGINATEKITVGTDAVAIDRATDQIRVEHTHDLTLHPLPPFANVTYWWEIEDTAGNRLQTAPHEFSYADNRFQWLEAQAGNVSVYWIEGQGDRTYAQTALDIAQASIDEINAELQAPLPDSLEIFIYDSDYHLEAAMVLGGRDWVAGQARPELGVVVVAVPADQDYTSRMKRYLPHEITHLIVYQLAGPQGYSSVPTWLDEGLATVYERLPTPEYRLALEEALGADQLLSLRDLCVPFSPDPATAFLSYAQSASVVRFIRDEYGAGGLRRLLTAYADGASCTSGVEEALGISFHRLESTWRASLRPDSRWTLWWDRAGVWVGLWVLSILVALPMVGRVRR